MIEIMDGVLPLVGALLGFIVGRRERNLRRPVLYPCDCGHSLSKHEEKGRCRARSGNCECRQYIGQRPVEIDLAPRQIDR